jgi:hypothetical protein
MSDSEVEQVPAKVEFTDAQRNLAAALAKCAAARVRKDQTKSSAQARLLWSQVGPQNFKNLVLTYMNQILVGINATYAGPKLFRAVVHMQKQALIDTVYKREIRDHVMKKVYSLYKYCVEPGAFARVLMTDEDFRSLEGGKIVVDESVAIEESLKYIIGQLKCDVEASQKLIAALESGIAISDMDIGSGVQDGDEYDSSEKLPAFVPVEGESLLVEVLDPENDEEVEPLPEEEIQEEYLESDDASEKARVDAEQARIQENYRQDQEEHERQLRILEESRRRQLKLMAAKRKPADINLVDDEDVPDSPPVKKPVRRRLLTLDMDSFRDDGLKRPAHIDLEDIFNQDLAPNAPLKKPRVSKKSKRAGKNVKKSLNFEEDQ